MELKEYRFFDQIAVQFGVDEAIFLHNLYFWVKKNTENGKNFRKGKYWTFNTAAQFKEIFPFWSMSKIYSIINGLVKGGVILKDNTLNRIKYDRTGWYTFSDIEKWNFIFREKQFQNQEMDLPELEVANDESNETLPDNIPDNRTTDKKEKIKKEKRKKQNKSNPITDISTGKFSPQQHRIEDNAAEALLDEIKQIYLKAEYSTDDYNQLIRLRESQIYSTIASCISDSRKQELSKYTVELAVSYHNQKNTIIQLISNRKFQLFEEVYVYLMTAVSFVSLMLR